MSISKVNNAEYYYEIIGTGHPLVLIAGYCCDHTYWSPVLEDLARHYQVITLDNRAVGQTKDSGEMLSVELIAKDVIQLVDDLNLKRPHVMGQSMGGAIAQTMAALYPDKINKLILLTSTAQCRDATLYAFETQLKMRQHNVDFDWLFQTMLPWVYSSEFIKNNQNVDSLKSLILNNPYMQSVEDQARQFNVLRQFNGIRRLKDIRAETLVVYGEQDIVNLPLEAKLIAGQIPQAHLVALNCAHGIVSEVPDQVIKLVTNFLS